MQTTNEESKSLCYVLKTAKM